MVRKISPPAAYINKYWIKQNNFYYLIKLETKRRKSPGSPQNQKTNKQTETTTKPPPNQLAPGTGPNISYSWGQSKEETWFSHKEILTWVKCRKHGWAAIFAGLNNTPPRARGFLLALTLESHSKNLKTKAWLVLMAGIFRLTVPLWFTDPEEKWDTMTGPGLVNA